MPPKQKLTKQDIINTAVVAVEKPRVHTRHHIYALWLVAFVDCGKSKVNVLVHIGMHTHSKGNVRGICYVISIAERVNHITLNINIFK